MKKQLLRLLFGVFCVGMVHNLSAQVFVYNESFTQGQTYCPGSTNYDNWGTFRSSLVPLPYISCKISGSLDPNGIECTDPVAVAQIAANLNSGNEISINCQGTIWRIGAICITGCAQAGDDVELNASNTGGDCSCSGPYAVRPCIGNSNWGGITITGCNAPTQTMIVEFVAPAYDNDAGITQIINPSLPTCGLDSQDVVVQVQNMGNDTLTSCDIKWQVNGGTINTFSYTGNVAPIGGLDTATITTNVNFSNGDVLTIWSENPNGGIDSLSSNDTSQVTLSTGLAGVYQIPGDYATFTDAANDLMAFGVCDTVIMNVAAGTYNEQVEIGSILGASATKPVIFQGATGNPANVRLEFDCSSNFSQNGVLHMNGANNVTFRDMTIDNTSSTTSYGKVVFIVGGSEELLWDNCVLSGSPTGTTSTLNAVVDAYNTPFHDINFTNSRIAGGSYGFRIYGNSSTHNTGFNIHNCEIDSFYYFGIYSYYVDSVEYTHNKVTSDWSYTSMRGIYLYDNDKHVRITHNQVYNNPNTNGNMYYPLYLGNCDGSLSNRIQINNNCVTAGNPNYTGFSYTFYLTNSGIMDVINNTITWITAPNATSGYVHYISGGGLITEKNNSFITTGSQYVRYVTSGYSMIESNNNNFYTNGNNMHYLGGLFSNTEDFANSTGFDDNSVEVTADFTDTLECTTCNDTLDGGGAPVPWVNDDINGENRSAQTPDIGAVEFIAAGSFTLGPDSAYCADELLLEAGPAQSVSWNVNGTSSSSPTYLLENTSGQPQVFNVAVNIITNGCGPASDNVAVTLIPNASLDSNIHICADESVTLEPGGGNTASYTWSDGSMTPTIDVNEPGTYSVTKMEDGCESMAFTIVTQSDAVDIADLEPCDDEVPFTIDATVNDGVNYAWSGGASPSTAINTFDQTDIYSVTVTDGFGCVSEDTFSLTVLQDPVADIGYNTTGGGPGVFFSSQNSQFTTVNSTFDWNFGDGNSSTAANPYHQYVWQGVPTTYTVSLEIDNGCGTDLQEMVITVDPLGTEEIESIGFALYPNPATDVLNITSENSWSELTVEITDLAGRVIASKQYVGGQDLINMSVSELSSGNYLVKLIADGDESTQPLVIR